MPYNFATESFHTKKLYSRLSSRIVKNGQVLFLSLLLETRGNIHCLS